MSLEAYTSPGGSQAILKKKLSTLGDWIVLDSNGGRRMVDVDKYEIMNQVQLHTRDLRILDPLLMYPSTILCREKAIVLNLEHIKAIITAKEVFLRDPLDDDVIPVIEELRRRLSSISSGSKGRYMNDQPNEEKDVEIGEKDGFCIAESPFEFRALEVALEAICSFLDARTTELETAAYPALHELTLKTSARNLDRVRMLKSAMTRLTARVQKIRDELENLLDNDDDMTELYLSRKLAVAPSLSGSVEGVELETSRAKSKSVATNVGSKNDVEQVEMLLEASYMQIDGTTNKLTTLREYIIDTEAYINIRLDNQRNQLIKAEFLLSSVALCLAVYSVVVGMFGTNIKYTWTIDGYGYMFKWVIIVTSLVCGLLHIFIVYWVDRKAPSGSNDHKENNENDLS